MRGNGKRIAIIGAGASACTLACFLRARGFEIFLFDEGKEIDLLVGESLIPASVPIMRRLGIEEEVAEFCQRKPGVSFYHGKSRTINFDFKVVAKYLPPYAYNVPRPRFDNLIKRRAVELGAELISCKARLQKADGDCIELAPETLAASKKLDGKQVDFIIDASGRKRELARLLHLPTKKGKRNDVAYFGHFKNVVCPEPYGQIAILRLDEKGWAWIIPLRDRVSVGCVINKDYATTLGKGAKQRLLAIFQKDKNLCKFCANAELVSDVKTYANYQRITEVCHGKNWLLCGDAFGFVDPMLSSGLFLALQAAVEADRHIFGKAANNSKFINSSDFEDAAQNYTRVMLKWLDSWTNLIEHFYNGNIFSLHEGGQKVLHGKSHIGQRIVEQHISRQIAYMLTGALTGSFYQKNMLRLFTTSFMLRDNQKPSVLAIN